MSSYQVGDSNKFICISKRRRKEEEEAKKKKRKPRSSRFVTPGVPVTPSEGNNNNSSPSADSSTPPSDNAAAYTLTQYCTKNMTKTSGDETTFTPEKNNHTNINTPPAANDDGIHPTRQYSGAYTTVSDILAIGTTARIETAKTRGTSAVNENEVRTFVLERYDYVTYLILNWYLFLYYCSFYLKQSFGRNSWPVTNVYQSRLSKATL